MYRNHEKKFENCLDKQFVFVGYIFSDITLFVEFNNLHDVVLNPITIFRDNLLSKSMKFFNFFKLSQFWTFGLHKMHSFGLNKLFASRKVPSYNIEQSKILTLATDAGGMP
jgi:hypothetical protein